MALARVSLYVVASVFLGIVVGGAPNAFIALLLAGEIVGLIVAFALLRRVGLQ
jgi:hypothetical protein